MLEGGIEIADTRKSVFDLLATPIRKRLRDLGLTLPTEPQVRAVEPVLKGRNVLLVAPTGSGKTEAVILPVLSNFIETRRGKGISILYITPLRALNRDMLKRLMLWGSTLNVSIEVRHGDTSSGERRKQALKPPDLLITTPETLQAILPGRRMQRHLRQIRWVVVDEIHQLVQEKRGNQLTIALERLREVTKKEFQRIGVSATVGDPQKVVNFLAGVGRQVEVIQVAVPKDQRYHVEWPYPAEEDYEIAHALFTSPESAARITRIKELVDNHTSTLIFVNSRQTAEMLGLRFHMLDPEIGVHHSSLSREERHRMEDDFKTGKLKGIICTSTLELGIDIGSIDLVIQYLSPRQVTSMIQRVGRAGHRIDRISEGTIVTAYTDDALEATAAVERAKAGKLELITIQDGALDVLAHQIAGLVMDWGRIELTQVYHILRRAYPYRDLDWKEFLNVAGYLERLGEVRVEGNHLVRRKKTRIYYYENLSMIPDEKRYPIIDLTTDRRVGILGEEFITTRARVGLNFICRGLVWKIRQISEEGVVYVIPADDPTAAIPGWDGEMIPVPYELAQETGRMRRKIAEMLLRNEISDVINSLYDELAADRYALRRTVEEVKEQMEMGALIPSDRVVLIESYDRFVVVHGCFGETVNRTLGYICDHFLSEKGLIRGWWADGYRILIEVVDLAEIYVKKIVEGVFSVSPDEAEEMFKGYVEECFPFTSCMKHVAERFGALPRGMTMGHEKLNYLPIRFSNTPIYKETLREAMIKKVDLATVKEILQSIQDGEIRIETFPSQEKPTPYAYRILNKFLEVPEMMAPESVKQETVERMKRSIMMSNVILFCISCGKWNQDYTVDEVPNRPECPRCRSGLIAVFRRSNPYAERSVQKRLRGELLSAEEIKVLSETRRNADLILSYGKKAIQALLVHGIGPQTASRILGKMHYNEEELYRDLLEAKLTYFRTRQYWNDKE